MSKVIYNSAILAKPDEESRWYSVEEFKELVNKGVKESKFPHEFLSEVVMYTYCADEFVLELIKEHDKYIQNKYNMVLKFAFSRLKDRDYGSNDATLDLNLPLIYYLLERAPTFHKIYSDFILKRLLEHYTGVNHSEGFPQN